MSDLFSSLQKTLLKSDDNKTLTENGAVAYKSIGDKLVDLDASVMSLRNATAEEVMQKVVSEEADRDLTEMIRNAEVAVIDPPRAGCDSRMIEALAQLAPERIVYVSCDPATMARDIKSLCEKGYEFAEATPADMFPWTRHVETVVLLSRKAD